MFGGKKITVFFALRAFLLGACLFWAWACQKPVSYAPNGQLVYSDDTLKFDTLFTTVQSPTQRLMIYNDGGALEVSEVYIEGGENSPFELILDGVKAQKHLNYQISGGDSVWAFVRMRKKVEVDSDITDRLVFKMGNRTDYIPLFARVRNAYLFPDTLIRQDVVLPTDKPIVVDGVLYVQNGATLTIPAGTKLYFSARKDANYNFNSGIYIGENATLNVDGTKENPVLFSNFRLDSVYQESPGQWLGIIIGAKSRYSKINYAIIKNGSIGVRVDSIATTPEPKLMIENTVIRNMSNYGILGLAAVNYDAASTAFSFIAKNCVIFDCGQCAVAAVAGGNYAVQNCTLANLATYGIKRSTPTFGVNNYYTGLGVFPLNVYMENTVVWGNLEDEVGVKDLKAGATVGISLKNCLFKSKLKAEDFDTGVFDQLFKNCLFNQDPLFKDTYNRNYAPTTGSALIDVGNDETLLPPLDRLPFDIAGKPRPTGPKSDIGAYEFQP